MSQSIEVILDDQGRLVLPSRLQHQLGLTPGTTLVVEDETSDAVYLRVETEQPRLAEKQGVLVVQSQAVGDLENTIWHERDRRVVELMERGDT